MVQWRHFERPRDAYTVRVDRIWELSEPRRVDMLHTTGRRRQGAGTRPVALGVRSLVCRPALFPDDHDHPREWRLRNGCTVQDIVGRGHTHRLCICVAQPVATLVMASAWTQIVTLARTHVPRGDARARAADFHSKIWKSFPPDEVLRSLNTEPVAINNAFTLRAESFHELSMLLRSWAPRVLAIRDEDGGENNAELALRESLRWLQSAGDALSIASRHADLRCTGRFYTSMQLFGWLRLCSMLRDQSRQRQTNLKNRVNGVTGPPGPW